MQRKKYTSCLLYLVIHIFLTCTLHNFFDNPCADCRKFFDGSGGNNCAVDHYKEGRGGGPLAVKLGTITRLANMLQLEL